MNTNPLWAEFMSSMQKMGSIHQAMKWNGISKGEFMVLSVIHREMRDKNEEEQALGVSVSVLAKMMHSSQPAASRLLKGMEEKQYILRRMDARDRRNTCVTITLEGEKKRESVCTCLENISDRVAKRMGDEKMRELIVLWDELAEYMQEEIEREKEIAE